MVTKIINFRMLDGPKGSTAYSLKDTNEDALVISQFTLHASTKKGNRPSYIKAARPEQAVPLYEYFLEKLWMESNRPVKAGEFGANMQVSLVNDGPVTILMDSKKKE